MYKNHSEELSKQGLYKLIDRLDPNIKVSADVCYFVKTITDDLLSSSISNMLRELKIPSDHDNDPHGQFKWDILPSIKKEMQKQNNSYFMDGSGGVKQNTVARVMHVLNACDLKMKHGVHHSTTYENIEETSNAVLFSGCNSINEIATYMSDNINDKYIASQIINGIPIEKLIISPCGRRHFQQGLASLIEFNDKIEAILLGETKHDTKLVDRNNMNSGILTKIPKCINFFGQNGKGIDAITIWLVKHSKLNLSREIPEVMWKYIFSFSAQEDLHQILCTALCVDNKNKMHTIFNKNDDDDNNNNNMVQNNVKKLPSGISIDEGKNAINSASVTTVDINFRWQSLNGKILKTLENKQSNDVIPIFDLLFPEIKEAISNEDPKCEWFQTNDDAFTLLQPCIQHEYGNFDICQTSYKILTYDALGNMTLDLRNARIIRNSNNKMENQSSSWFSILRNVTKNVKKEEQSSVIDIVILPFKQYQEKQMSGEEIYRVLKQVHPDTNISRVGMDTMIGLLYTHTQPLLVQTALNQKRMRLPKMSNVQLLQNLTARDIQDAVRTVFPGELAKNAVSEGTKAITMCTSRDINSHVPWYRNNSGNKSTWSADARLQFPVRLIAWATYQIGKTILGIDKNEETAKNCDYPSNISKECCVYLSAVLEYLCAEILELGGNAARDNKTSKLSAYHIMLGIRGDGELNKQFEQVCWYESGYLPITSYMKQKVAFDLSVLGDVRQKDALEELSLNISNEQIAKGVVMDNISTWKLARCAQIPFANVFDIAPRLENILDNIISSLLNIALSVSSKEDDGPRYIDYYTMNYALSCHKLFMIHAIVPTIVEHETTVDSTLRDQWWLNDDLESDVDSDSDNETDSDSDNETDMHLVDPRHVFSASKIANSSEMLLGNIFIEQNEKEYNYLFGKLQKERMRHIQKTFKTDGNHNNMIDFLRLKEKIENKLSSINISRKNISNRAIYAMHVAFERFFVQLFSSVNLMVKSGEKDSTNTPRCVQLHDIEFALALKLGNYKQAEAIARNMTRKTNFFMKRERLLIQLKQTALANSIKTDIAKRMEGLQNNIDMLKEDIRICPNRERYHGFKKDMETLLTNKEQLNDKMKEIINNANQRGKHVNEENKEEIPATLKVDKVGIFSDFVNCVNVYIELDELNGKTDIGTFGSLRNTISSSSNPQLKNCVQITLAKLAREKFLVKNGNKYMLNKEENEQSMGTFLGGETINTFVPVDSNSEFSGTSTLATHDEMKKMQRETSKSSIGTISKVLTYEMLRELCNGCQKLDAAANALSDIYFQKGINDNNNNYNTLNHQWNCYSKQYFRDAFTNRKHDLDLSDFPIETAAIDGLQLVVESYLSNLFRCAIALAKYNGRKVLKVKDVQFANKMRTILFL